MAQIDATIQDSVLCCNFVENCRNFLYKLLSIITI